MTIRGWICCVQALLLGLPAHGAMIPMGVARVGTSPGVKAVQSRLERWLAGEESRVRRVQEGISQPALSVQKSRAQFIRLLDQIDGVLEGPKDVRSLKALVASAAPLGKLAETQGWGLLVQRWYRSRGLLAAAQGKPTDWHLRARAFHPTGKLSRGLPSKDWFQAWGARRVTDGGSTSRQCRWSVSEGAQLWVNGFVAGQSVLLAPGRHVLVAQNGGQWFERVVQCRRPSRQHWNLENAVPLGNRSPERVVQRYGVDHLWLVEKGGRGGYRLVVFTPGFGAEEVPVDHPLGAEGLLAPFEGEFRVDWDKARALLQSHRSQVLAQRGHLRWTQSQEPVETPDEWYNDWKFWAITAGVVGGVLTVISLTREDSVQTQPTPRISINF